MKEERITQPFIVSGALPVFPAKLVKKILNGKVIDMAKLLKDNMEIERRRHSAEGKSGSSIGGMGRHEILDMLSWLNCFSLYAAVVCSKYPHKASNTCAQGVVGSTRGGCKSRAPDRDDRSREGKMKAWN